MCVKTVATFLPRRWQCDEYGTTFIMAPRRERGAIEMPLTDDETPLLIEGIDFYVENGRWVFTAIYHLRRGKCCESGCRHCPFDKIDVNPNDEKPVIILRA